MTQHNYTEALKAWEDFVDDKIPTHHLHAHEPAIRHALKLAEKIMQEPSEGMIEAGWNAYGEADERFKAMIAEAQREAEEAQG